MTKISATELARHLSDILNRVRYRGERFVVERGGEPVAVIEPPVPRPTATVADLVALLRDVPWPDEDFAKDLEEIQASQPSAFQEDREWD